METARSLLDEQHAHIDALAPALMSAMRTQDMAAAETAWTPLEEAILDHLDDEEAYIFPTIERDARAQVAKLREEHARIRRLVGELGVALDLHLVRLELLEELATALREHAAREKVLLDEHTEKKLPLGTQMALLRRAHRRRSRHALHAAVPGPASPCADPRAGLGVARPAGAADATAGER